MDHTARGVVTHAIIRETPADGLDCGVTFISDRGRSN